MARRRSAMHSTRCLMASGLAFAFNISRVNFCEQCKIGVQFHSFAAPFIEDSPFLHLVSLDLLSNMSRWCMHRCAEFTTQNSVGVAV